MTRFLLICLGGAVGTGARHALSSWMASVLGTSFPYGTLAVNVIGSFLLAVIMQIGMSTELLSTTARMTLSIGVMGGFTTYSTFSYETFESFRSGAWALGFTNVLVTVVACLVACMLGFWVGKALVA